MGQPNDPGQFATTTFHGGYTGRLSHTCSLPGVSKHIGSKIPSGKPRGRVLKAPGRKVDDNQPPRRIWVRPTKEPIDPENEGNPRT
jgi:hypothetical protein